MNAVAVIAAYLVIGVTLAVAFHRRDDFYSTTPRDHFEVGVTILLWPLLVLVYVVTRIDAWRDG